MVHIQFWPFQVFFLLGEARPSERGSSLAQEANKVITEVKRRWVLIRHQPPNVRPSEQEETNGC